MKIGVFGLGSIGLRHAKNLITLGQQVWGYDPDIVRSQMLVDAGGNGCSEKEVFNTEAFVVATPTNTHSNFLCKLIPTNKWIFIEKPIADEGIKFNEETGKRIFVGYNLRQHSCVKKAKEWIEAGFLGTPLWANITVGQYNDRYTDGVILNWSHEIDLALYLLGRGSVAGSSTRSNNGRDDIADILLTHESGCRSAIHLDYVTRPEVRQSIIVGSEATIIIDIVHREAWLRSKDAIMLDHQGVEDSFDENYVEEMQAFLDRMNGKKTIGCDGNEAREVLKVCLEAKKLSQ